MKQPTLDLIIPGLLNLPVYELNSDELTQSTPALHKLLRYAQRVPNILSDVDDILLHRLRLQQSALPYAFAINADRNYQQCLFKPIHLKADINNAIVFPVDLEKDEINILINDLKEFFNVDFDIKSLPDKSWLMTLYNVKPVQEVPHYLSALGKKVTHYLEQSKSNLDWFKLFNEMQMFLYQHEINQRRQLDGLPIINSLWCWGADSYQGEKLKQTLWFSDDVDMLHLGQLYAGNSAPIQHILQANLNTDSIIIDLSLLKLLKGQHDGGLLQAVKSLEKNYLQVLMKLTKHRIVLHTGGSTNFEYNAFSSLKFWKKPVTINQIIVQSQSMQTQS